MRTLRRKTTSMTVATVLALLALGCVAPATKSGGKQPTVANAPTRGYAADSAAATKAAGTQACPGAAGGACCAGCQAAQPAAAKPAADASGGGCPCQRARPGGSGS